MGKDWSQTPCASGERAVNVEVITQMSERLPGPVAKFTWNAPFEFSLKSTNVSGWPQIGIALSTINRSGADETIGYARCHVPMRSGHKTIDLPLIAPMFSTDQHKLFGIIAGTKPELRDMAFLCSGEDRVVMTAQRLPGYVRVSFNVHINGMSALGYDV
jgi:hypothetical protein